MMKWLTLLIKPASSSCNMRCKYCFYADITDIRDIKNYGMMDKEVLRKLVKNALSQTSGVVNFGFQGGEPTLAGLEFFKWLVEFEKEYNINNVKITHSLQTNGLSLDKSWTDFFAENDFLIGLSIDSTKQIHDALREDSVGKGTHTRILKSAKLLSESGAQFNILTVLTKMLASHPDKVYGFYKQQDFRYIQFIPCLDGIQQEHGENSYSLDAKTYGNFLCRTFDLWHSDYIKGDYYSIRTFDNYIQMIAGYPPEACAMAGKCTAYPLVEANGDVFPCDFYAMDEYRLGNVMTDNLEEILRGQKAKEFVNCSLHVDDDCKECKYYSLCRGGCRRDREPVIDGVPSKNYYCEAYKMFFEHAGERMWKIARNAFGRQR